MDKDTGEQIDVRELLGITEEDFRNNPQLLDVLQTMNLTMPVEEENYDGEDMSNVVRSTMAKKRHRKMNYDIIGGFENVLQAGDDVAVGHSSMASNVANQGAFNWAKWWERKDQSNQALVEAIKQQNAKLVQNLLSEQQQLAGVCADLNHRLDFDETPLHCAVDTGNKAIVKLLI